MRHILAVIDQLSLLKSASAKAHCCPGKMRSTEMLCSNLVVMLKLSLKFNTAESVVPAQAGTQ